MMHNTLLKRFLNSRSRNRKSKACPELRRRIKNRKWVGIFAIVVALTVCGARAEAQQTGKGPRIGFLDTSTASGIAVLLEAFRQELLKLGWIEGKNFLSSTGMPSKRMSACLSLQRTWFVLRLI
jgi:hypothetical protein